MIRSFAGKNADFPVPQAPQLRLIVRRGQRITELLQLGQILRDRGTETDPKGIFPRQDKFPDVHAPNPEHIVRGQYMLFVYINIGIRIQTVKHELDVTAAFPIFR
ncbi:hypothetical protein D1872_233230 [compost metagenome]